MQFPTLFRRYLASLVDIIMVIALVGLIGNLPLAAVQDVPPALIFLIVIAAYEPLLSVFACTVGQFVMRIRVRRSQDRHRIGVGRAVARVYAKYLLGLASFLTMPLQKEKRAVHDLLTGTLVLDARSLH